MNIIPFYEKVLIVHKETSCVYTPYVHKETSCVYTPYAHKETSCVYTPYAHKETSCVYTPYVQCWESQVPLAVKSPPANARDIRDVGSIPGSGSLRGGNGYPLQ